jgi:hypothetical protein
MLGLWRRGVFRPPAAPYGLEAVILAARIVVTVVLLLEVLPAGVAGVARARPGVTRLDGLARLGLLEGRNQWVVPTFGGAHLVGGAAILVGVWMPAVGIVGAAWEAALFGWVLWRQVRHGDRGGALFAYSLFTALAVAVVVIDTLR